MAPQSCWNSTQQNPKPDLKRSALTSQTSSTNSTTKPAFTPEFMPCVLSCTLANSTPSLASHLQEVEVKNDIPLNSVALASWCKQLENRSPNQKTAILKVLCASPEADNLFITGCICIDDHLVNVWKDIKLPIRCLKCQEYGHMQDTCASVEKCTNCSSVSHSTYSSVQPPLPPPLLLPTTTTSPTITIPICCQSTMATVSPCCYPPSPPLTPAAGATATSSTATAIAFSTIIHYHHSPSAVIQQQAR